MSLLLFEGAAGTGKSTQLLAAAKVRLEAAPLGPEQGVLALTKYHGSRRRMASKLQGRGGLGVRVHCATIDGFAWSLVRRWRALARHLSVMPNDGDFGATTSAAAKLLEHGMAPWVARTYPLLIVDEMQDCKGGEVGLIAELARHLTCLAAADGFQDLSGEEGNEAIDWASSEGHVRRLAKVHRTSQAGLLDAAGALRGGSALTNNRWAGFEVLSAPKAPMGAAITNWRIKSWSKHGRLAVITPTTWARSKFVAGLTQWCSTKKAKSSRSTDTAGPYDLPWESNDSESCEQLRMTLALPDDPLALMECEALRKQAEAKGASDLAAWLRHQRFVLGRSEVAVGTVVKELALLVRRRRAYGGAGTRRRLALTVHQAKNREFDTVIVLWPLAVRKGLQQQRRLLYNAITRAKKHAVVIVEDPKRNRLNTQLFAGDLKT